MSHRGLGDLEKATTFMDEALRLNPSSITHLNNYGVILAENGKIEEAKAKWEKVLELEPDNTVAKQNLSALRR
jgi:Flp pilus assembly protein TadD